MADSAPDGGVPLVESLASDRTVKAVVEPTSLELGVTRALLADPTRPVWFKAFRGATLVGNLWATRERVAAYFGVGPLDLPDLLLHALDHPRPPEVVTTPARWQVHKQPADLTKLPVPWFYPKDAGPYLTAAVFSATWEGKRNLSYHRVWVQGPQGGPTRLVPRHLDRMVQESRKKDVELPVAVILGGPLEFLLAAAVSTDYAVDEMEIASALHHRRTGHPLKVVKLAHDLHVPVDAEIVLEGKVTREDRAEGPFVDILGTYDPIRQQPVVRFETQWSCEKPVFHAILPGALEHFLLMGLPREPAILRSVRGAVPGTKAVRLTEGGSAWLHGVVSIEKRREGDGRNAILAAFAGHPSMKRVVVVDQDIDIFNDREVEWALATRFQADKGMVLVPGATGSSLDPSATPDGITTKWGLDATLPLKAPRGPFTRERFPKEDAPRPGHS